MSGMKNFQTKAVVIPSLSSICALAVDANPTPIFVVSLVVVGASVWLWTWVTSYAPSWMLWTQSLLVAVVSDNSVTRVLALTLLAFTALSTPAPDRVIDKNLILAGVNINLTLHLGVSSLTPGALSVMVSIAILGFAGLVLMHDRPRWLGRLLVLGFGIYVTALAAFCAAGLACWDSLRDGRRAAEAAMAALRVGDMDAALRHIDLSLKELERSESWLGSPLSWPSRIVPIVGQNRDFAVGVVSALNETLGKLRPQLAAIDLDSLKIVDGRIDIAAISRLRDPLEISTLEIESLRKTLEQFNNPWLLPQFGTQIRQVSDDLRKLGAQGENALTSIRLAPTLLGAESPRTYFIALTTAAESRGHGGFMGSWVELSIEGGQLEVTDQGRSTDLNASGTEIRKISGPSDWLGRYGDFGFTTGVGGGVSKTAWQNITMSPYFDSTGRVIAELYPQSGGKNLDGVFAMDIKTLATLLEFSGPVIVDGLAEPLTTANAESFLLFDQYRYFETNQRIDLLEEVLRVAIDQILEGELPSPNIIANRLGPMVAQGRLTAFSTNQEVQEFFETINMDGTPPCDETDDCLFVTADNASGSKIDVFLDLGLKTDVEIDENRGIVTATVHLDLRNNAPSLGLPEYVIGNLVGLPLGYNRTLISIHSSLFLSPMDSPDGKGWGVRNEKGLNVYSTYLDLEPGSVEKLELVFQGRANVEQGMYSLGTRLPAAAGNWTSEFQAREGGETKVFRLDDVGNSVIRMKIE